MHWLKHFVRVAPAIVLVATAVSTGEPAWAQEPKQIKIAYSVDVLDETQNVALTAMQKRVDEINTERDDIEVVFDVYDAQSNVDKQLSDVQTALIKEPDVLLFSAVDAVGSLPAAQAAKDAGVLTIDR